MTAAATFPAPAQQRVLLLALIALGGALTGFSGILLRLSEIGPMASGGWRLAIAALAFLPMAMMAGGDALRPSNPAILALAGLFFAVDIGFYHVSLGFTAVAHSTLIVNLAPVVALTAGVALFGERLGAAKLTGMAAALSGAIVMTSIRAQSEAGSGGTLTGNALAVLSMLGYAAYLIVVKHARRGHGTFAIMLWSSASAAICLFAGAAAAGETLVPATVEGWAVVIVMGLVTHVAGQGLVAFGMRETPVGLGSIFLLTQPLVAAIVAWPMFGETLGPLEILGAGLVLLGLALASRSN